MEEQLFENFFDQNTLDKMAGSEEPVFESKELGLINEEKSEKKSPNKEKPIEEEQILSIEEQIKKDFGKSIEELANEESENDKSLETPAKIEAKTHESKSTSSSSTPSQMSNLAKVLYEAGVISTEESELENVKGVDDLVGLVTKTVEAKKFDGLNEDQKNYLKALEAGVPLDVYQKKRADQEIYNKITSEQIEENANLRASIIKNSFILKGFNDTKATELTKRAFDTEADVKDAKEALEEIKAYTQSTLQKEIETKAKEKEERESKSKKDLEDLKNTVTKKDKIFDSVQINSQTKEKIIQSITTPVGEKDGVPVNDVMKSYFEDPEYKIRLHALNIITKGFTDFSKFTNTTKTKAAIEFEKSLENGVYNVGTTKGGNPLGSNNDIANAFESTFLNNK